MRLRRQRSTHSWVNKLLAGILLVALAVTTLPMVSWAEGGDAPVIPPVVEGAGDSGDDLDVPGEPFEDEEGNDQPSDLLVPFNNTPSPLDFKLFDVKLTTPEGYEFGDDVEQNASFIIEYTFELVDAAKVAGNTYTQQMPTSVTPPSSDSVQRLTSNGFDLGSATFKTDGSVEIVFGADADNRSARKGGFTLNGTFNETVITGETTVSFPLGGSVTKDYKIKFKNDPIVSPIPKIEKNVLQNSYDPATGTVEWEVVVSTSAADLDSVTVTDTLNTNHAYVANSGKAKLGTGEFNSELGTFGFDAQKLTYTYSGKVAVGEPLTLRYKTQVVSNPSLSHNNGTVSINLTNSAKIEPNEQHSGTNPVSRTYGIETDWLKKASSLKNQSVSGGRTIVWTVTINGSKNTISDETKLTDKIPQKLTLKTDTITLKKGTDDAVTLSPDQFVYDTDSRNLTYTFNDAGTDTYVLTYETTIDEAYYQSMGGKVSFTNDAFLDVVGDPKVSSTANIGDSVVTKGGTYVASNQEITWTISVNSNKADIVKGYIEDTLTMGQEFLSLESAQIGSTSITLNPVTDEPDQTGEYRYNEGEKKLTVYLGDFNESAAIVFKTRVTNPDHYAKNKQSTSYTNEAVFKGTDLELKGSGTAPVTSTVLSKSHGNYDYVNNRVTWTIIVNQNKMLMKGTSPAKGPVITDTIGVGHAYVPGTFTISANGTPTDNHTLTEDRWVLTSDLDDLQVYRFEFPDEIQNQYTITYQTEITDPTFFQENKTQTFGNEVVVAYTTGQNNDVTQNVSSSISPTNIAVGKDSITRVNDEPYIDWIVPINAGKVKIKDAKIVDVLQPQLMLDEDSVKLYKATKNASTGKLEADITQPVSLRQPLEYIAVGEADENGKFKHQLTIFLPDSSESAESGDAYVLKFRTDISSKYSFTVTNNITLSGTGFEKVQTAEKVITGVFVGSGWGTGQNGSITIKKIDAVTKQPLANAKFELEDQFGDKKTGTTGQNGLLTFDKLLYVRYTLRETEAPTGYKLLAGEKSFKLSAENPNIDDVVIENGLLVNSFSFTKVRTSQTPIAGAEFTLYKVSPGTETIEDGAPTYKATSDPDGIVSFTDIPVGEYIARETQAPAGYLHTNEVVHITIAPNSDNTDTTVAIDKTEIQNTKATADLTFTKTTTSGTALAGAEFGLYNEAGTLINTTKSDGSGNVKFEAVEYGKYTIKELNAPSGYIKSDVVLQAEVTVDTVNNIGVGTVTPNTVTNAPVPPGQTNPPIIPYTPAPSPTPGATPSPTPSVPGATPTPGPSATPAPSQPPVTTPEDTPTDGEVDIPDNEIPTIGRPPKNGTVTVDENGKWTYTPNPGYTGDDDFTIIIGDEEVPFGVKVTPKGTLPKTGEESDLPLLLGGFTLMGLGVVAAVVANRKKQAVKGKR